MVPSDLRTTFAAVIFDMDGVVTDTAAVHASAWKSLFDALLADEPSGRKAPREASSVRMPSSRRRPSTKSR
jgi:beta-phosphoglucomutase-like phosphatase (HAD superfamily)